MKTLVVEDEQKMAYFLAKGLRAQAYAVDVAKNGEEALYCAEMHEYDFVLLDVGLPRKDGLAVCRELRSKGFMQPILMLTAADGAAQRIAALNDGADDYLAKPFDFEELLARMRALLRRSYTVRSNTLQVADLCLNRLSRTATRGGSDVPLTAKEYALLEFMMLRTGEVLDRASIAEHVWDKFFDPMSNVIDVYINRLRNKIDGTGQQQLVFTRRSEGYILVDKLSAAVMA